MQKLLPYAQLLSSGFAVAVTLIVYVLSAAVVFPVLAELTSATLFVSGMIAFSAVSLVFGYVVFFLGLAAFVVAARGRSSVAYATVSQCRSIVGWLFHSWNFFSEGGQQEGLRLAGIEISLQGRL